MRPTFMAPCAFLVVAAIVACGNIAAAQTTPVPTAPTAAFLWNNPIPNANVPTQILSLNATHVLVLSNEAYAVSRANGTTTLLAPALVPTPFAAVVLPQQNVAVFCGVGANFEGAYVTAVNISTGAFVWSVNGSSSNGCTQILYSAKTGFVVVVAGAGSPQPSSIPMLYNAASGAQRQLPAFAVSSANGGTPPNVVLSAKGSTLFMVTGEGSVLSAFDVATSASLWNASIAYYLTGFPITTASAVDSGVLGGVVVIGGYSVCSAVNGSQLWTVGNGNGNSAVFSAGVAFVVSQNGWAFAYNASGHLLWSRTGGSYAFLAAYRGVAYFTSGNGGQAPFVAGVDAPSGRQMWAVPGITGSFAVAANNELYLFATQYGVNGQQPGVLALGAKHGALLDFWSSPSGTPTIYHLSRTTLYVAGVNLLAAIALSPAS